MTDDQNGTTDADPVAPDPDGADPSSQTPQDPSPDADAQREKAIRMAQIGLVVFAIVVVALVLFSRSGDDEADEAKPDAKGQEAGTEDGKPAEPIWPPTNVRGRPPALGKVNQEAADVQVGAGAKPGVYVWNDYDGWHLWVVPGEGVGAIKGTIQGDGGFTKANPAIAGVGTATVGATNDKVLTFDLPPTPGLVGVDFNGYTKRSYVFTISNADGTPFDPKKLFVGSKAATAPAPFVINATPAG